MGNAQAQVLLAELLLTRYESVRAAARFKSVAEERDRAIVLFEKAAAQACVVHVETERQGPLYIGVDISVYLWKIEVADRLVSHLRDAKGRDADIALWRARGIVHCGQYNDIELSNAFFHAKGAENRGAALAMILLTNNAESIASAKARATPEIIEIAERKVVELRRLVAASEAEYPAPKYKEPP